MAKQIPCDRHPSLTVDEFCRLALERGLFVQDDEGVIRGPIPWSSLIMQRIAACFHSDYTTTHVN